MYGIFTFISHKFHPIIGTVVVVILVPWMLWVYYRLDPPSPSTNLGDLREVTASVQAPDAKSAASASDMVEVILCGTQRLANM